MIPWGISSARDKHNRFIHDIVYVWTPGGLPRDEWDLFRGIWDTRDETSSLLAGYPCGPYNTHIYVLSKNLNIFLSISLFKFTSMYIHIYACMNWKRENDSWSDFELMRYLIDYNSTLTFFFFQWRTMTFIIDHHSLHMLVVMT